jgi:hypothetical protein
MVIEQGPAGSMFRNEILAALPAREIEALRPLLNGVTLISGQVLHQPDNPITDVFFVEAGVVSLTSRLPSYSHHPESIGKHGEFGEHGSEPLDQRQQPRPRHGGDQIVKHAALPEQRVSAPFGGV